MAFPERILLSTTASLWMIHGNLQTPKVWRALSSQLHQACSPDLILSTVVEDLWMSPGASLQEWATFFCERVQCQSSQPRFLLAYSLGGRLAFHALLQQPELWQGAIVISADPGLDSQNARQQCLARDIAWGNKFLHNNWDDVLDEWNALPVFCDRPPPYMALEQDFSQAKIAQTFRKFSKGHQKNLLLPLQKLNIPILFISGEADQKYCKIGQTLAKQCPSLAHQIMPDSGHRVPWENSTVFVSTVHQFLKGCLKSSPEALSNMDFSQND